MGTFFHCKITFSDSNRRVQTKVELPLPFKMQPQHSHHAGKQDSGPPRQRCEVFCWRLHGIGGIPLADQAVLLFIYIYIYISSTCMELYVWDIYFTITCWAKTETREGEKSWTQNLTGLPRRVTPTCKGRYC
jgi:hypothetical protein